jgi:Flp pilus assembly protein TadD
MLLDVCIASSPEVSGQQAAAATVLLRQGDAAGARRLHRQARDADPRHPSSWINLAALAVGLGDAAAARTHARQALSLAPRATDAWVNFGVACWHAGQRREAAQATQHALVLAPGMEVAALNLALMFRAAQQPQRARETLEAALARNAGSVRLREALAMLCRLLGDTAAVRTHALAALAALLPGLQPEPGREDDGPEPANAEAQGRLLATMTDVCDRLQAAGIDHHLVGGVVVGIVREGQPFAGDKDVDVGVDFDVDRDRVAAAFAVGYQFMQTQDPEGRRWCMGFVHQATGIGVDLFFKQRVAGMLRINLGWPDYLVFDVPEYRVEPFHWRGRAWPMPAPLDDYLAADYGADWRMPTREVAGHVFDKRWLDSQISSPSLVPDSLPRALNLAILRLLQALQGQRWPKALALCNQILARESLDQVEAVRRQLLEAGIR